LSKEIVKGIIDGILTDGLSDTHFDAFTDEANFHFLGNDNWNAVLKPQNFEYSALVKPRQSIELKGSVHTSTMGIWCCDKATGAVYFITNCHMVETETQLTTPLPHRVELAAVVSLSDQDANKYRSKLVEERVLVHESFHTVWYKYLGDGQSKERAVLKEGVIIEEKLRQHI